MALSRKLLRALGIEDDKIEEIITAHTDTVEALKAERDKYKADAEELPVVRKELDELKSGKTEDAEYKGKFEKLTAEFEEYKSGVEKEKTTEKKRAAYRDLLKDAGVIDRSIDSILRVTDLDKIELDKDGKVKDAEKAKEAIKTEWAGFVGIKEEHGAGVATPPGGAGGGGGTGKSRAAEIAAKYRRDLYGDDKKGAE